MHNSSRSMIRLLITFSCAACILISVGCSGANGSLSNIQPDTSSTENNISNGPSEELIPVLVYSADKLTIVDYERNKYIETASPSASINKKYIWSGGYVKDVKTLETLKTISSDGCILYTGGFISLDRMALLNCTPPDSTDNSSYYMRVINVQDGSTEKEFFLEDLYTDIITSPDGKMFAIAGGSMCGRIFDTNTLEELPQPSDCEFAGFLNPSADPHYFLAMDSNRNVCIWQWTANGVEKVREYGVSGISAASISAEGKILAYDPMGNPGDFVFEDFLSGAELTRINYPYQTDWESALSPDGSFFFLSTTEEGGEDYYLIVFDLKNNRLVHKFGPYGITIPSYLRIEYLPASIRDLWDWISY